MKFVDAIIVKEEDWKKSVKILEDAGIEVFTQQTRAY